MRHANLFTCMILAAGFVLSALTAHSQSPVPPVSPGGDQARSGSHQMNQPLPIDPKYNLSSERVEEIRQLYLEAKKELEKKSGAKTPSDQ